MNTPEENFCQGQLLLAMKINALNISVEMVPGLRPGTGEI